MRTPDGRECSYYYANYHRRVASKEVCRLLEGQPDARRWTSALCATCPAPDIQRANGCPNLLLHAHIGKPRWRFWEHEQLLIHATCTYTNEAVPDPYTGCGHCHDTIIFVVAEEESKE